MSEGAAQITYRLGWVALVGFWGGMAVLLLLAISPRGLVERLGWVGDALAYLIFSAAYFTGFASLIGVLTGVVAMVLFPADSPGRALALSGLFANGAVLLPWLLLLLLWSGYWPPPRPYRPIRELPRLARGRAIGIPAAKYRVSATSETHEVLALVLVEDSVIDGLPCRAGTEVSFDPRSGEVIQFVPSATLRLDRKRCAADRVVCRDEGKVRRFTTSGKRSVQGQSIPDGSEIMPPESQSFVEAGNLPFNHTQILLAADKILDGIPCKAGAPVILTKGRVEGATLSSKLERRGFSWAEGTIWERIAAPSYERVTGTLAEDKDVAGVPCRAGARVTVEVFDGSASVRRATLARDWKGYGVLFAANTTIYRGGECLRGTLARDVLIDRVPCLAGHELELDLDHLLEATLSRDHVIHGMPCASGTVVRFRNGRLEELTLSRPYRATYETFEAGARLTMDQWGEPRRHRAWRATDVDRRLDKPTRLARLRLAAGSELSKDWDFPIVVARLHEPHDVHGVPIPAGSELELCPWWIVKVRLHERAVVNGIAFASDTELEIRRGHGLVAARSSGRQRFGEIEVEGYRAEFHPGGGLSRLWPRIDVVYRGIAHAGRAGLGMATRKDGSLIFAVLAEAQEIDGTDYAAHTALQFDHQGRVTRAIAASDRPGRRTS